MTQLSVNVDHVATLRQARGVSYPDPVEAARLAEGAGASGITAHLRVDRRHVQDDDIARLAASVAGKLNLEMSTADEMVQVALAHRPGQVSLVPERPEEVTTEGGLDLTRHGERVAEVAARLAAAGVAVSIFLDPDPAQLEPLERANERAGGVISGFEINTDAYIRSPGEAELAKVREMARRGAERGFAVYAGHGLTPDNVGPVAAIPEVEELNIGHAIVARAVYLGMAGAVREMLAAMGEGSHSP